MALKKFSTGIREVAGHSPLCGSPTPRTPHGIPQPCGIPQPRGIPHMVYRHTTWRRFQEQKATMAYHSRKSNLDQMVYHKTWKTTTFANGAWRRFQEQKRPWYTTAGKVTSTAWYTTKRGRPQPLPLGRGWARMSFVWGLKSIKSKPPISPREWGFAAGLEKRENLQLTKHSP